MTPTPTIHSHSILGHVEATQVAPDRAGAHAGLDGATLSKALRRHLASAIDALVEYGQHPYQAAFSVEQPGQRSRPLQTEPPTPSIAEGTGFSDFSLGDELEAPGQGMGQAETGA